MNRPPAIFCGLALFWAVCAPGWAQLGPAAQPTAPARSHLADYDSELRRPDGRVDNDALAVRLKELGVTTYYWLIWHAPTDWDDLKLFLPKAQAAGIEVWAYLVPPSESPPQYGKQYSEPFRLDYPRWAEEIARLSLDHTNLTGWVIDDFYANHQLFTPAYLGEMQARAKRLNSRLALLPLMYFNELRPKFIEDYRAVIDGVVVAYLQGREEIERSWALCNDADIALPGEIMFPWNTPSRAGDFAMASQPAKVLPAQRRRLSFRERDDFTGPTAGYHFKQLLVDNTVVWEEDVAGGTSAWHEVAMDISDRVRDKTNVTVALRLLDKKGVSNFGVRWSLSDLRVEGLQLAADFTEPQKWQGSQQGPFETGFGEAIKIGRRRFHVPFISMTAGDTGEFRQRHGDPATPQRIAEQLRLSLQAWQEGKCDGVVTYCLDKRPASQTFPLAQKLFRDFKATAGNTASPLPAFRYHGVVLEASQLKYRPHDDVIYPTVVRVAGRIANPPGKYFMYYAPHDVPGGICLAYADKPEGPWREHTNNPVIAREWPPHFKVSHVSGPDAIWSEEESRLFLYFHGENPVTRLATSADGIHFDYAGEVVSTRMFTNLTEASYGRVFRHQLPGKDNRYVMLLMGNDRGTRRIYLAWSKDGRQWEPRQAPLMNPPPGTDQTAGAVLVDWEGRTYLVAHANDSKANFNEGFDLYLAQTDAALEAVKPLGKFLDHTFVSPANPAVMSPCFLKDEGRFYLFFNIGPRLRNKIALAVSEPLGIGSKAK